VRSRGEPLRHFDLHCPLMSLPLAFGTTLESIPADVPYLSAPPERIAYWRARLPRSPRLRVGLVWSGNLATDRNRSLAFDKIEPMLALPNIEFVCLQKDVRAADGEALRRREILDLGGELVDFAETAAVMAQLDLMITVDTASAHLAGAIGLPVHILLSHRADWRWLTDRDDSPWYPTARLFRQREPGNWDHVIRRVARAIALLSKEVRTPAAVT
jgi:Glycosyltransferase family 9 (heptosyltransferase)